MRALLLAAVAMLTLGASNADSIHSMDWLAGHTWRARGDGLGGKLAYIAVRYDWATTKNFIQFSTQFVNKDGSVDRSYAGNFYYDPSADRLTMWYMNEGNEIVQGPVTVDGNVLRMTFKAPGDDGRPEDFRVDLTQLSSVAYRWSLSGLEGSSWKPLLSLEYDRLDR